MVLGPDLVGWKLSEARVWAMLRDEEALQARHTLPHTREHADMQGVYMVPTCYLCFEAVSGLAGLPP